MLANRADAGAEGSVIVHKQRARLKQAGFISRSGQRSGSAGSVRTNWPPPNPHRLPAAGGERAAESRLHPEDPPELKITNCWLTLWLTMEKTCVHVVKQRKQFNPAREDRSTNARVTEQEEAATWLLPPQGAPVLRFCTPVCLLVCRQD